MSCEAASPPAAAGVGGLDQEGLWHDGVVDENGSLSLSNLALRSVSLCFSPRQAENLRSISLAANGLRTLSLQGLNHCPNLEKAVLNGNAFKTLDLSPLSYCTKLERLWLHNNCLTSIDLGPLASCLTLRSLYLDGNKLDDKPLSLAPLAQCTILKALRLGRNKLAGTLDISPLLQMQQLSTLDVSAAVKLVAYVKESKSSAQAAAAALPPALRRRAATVMWTCPPKEEAKKTITALGGCAVQSTKQPRKKTNRPTLYYSVLLMGFGDSQRFGVEALLKAHGAKVAAFRKDANCGLMQVRKSDVLLVKGSALYTLKAIRSCGISIPVILIGDEESDEDISASCVLKEPLFPRDAITIANIAFESMRHRSSSSFVKQVEESTAQLDKLQTFAKKNGSMDGPHLSDFSCGLPTSPVSSSDSSPPSGVPITTCDPFVDYYEISTSSPVSPSLITPVTPSRDDPFSAADNGHVSRIQGAVLKRAKSYPRAASIDFAKLRRRSSSCGAVRTRIEDSALGLLFSRCGGSARVSEFHSVATLCGLPVCVGPSLYQAALNSVNTAATNGKRETSNGSMERRSKKCSSAAKKNGTTHGVSYETFWQFWWDHLKDRSCEERLFNVLKIAYSCKNRVPAEAVGKLAESFMAGRATSDNVQLGKSQGKYSTDAPSIAAAVLCYEFKGASGSFSKRDLARARLCSSLLAAESTIYEGVASHLRIDRMREICKAFSLAVRESSGRGGDHVLSQEDVVSYHQRHSLLTPRVVEAIFARHIKSELMRLDSFAPMCLAVNDLTSASAANYFFKVLDADQDGYINAGDCAHFYIAKHQILSENGYVPIAFEHIWQSMVDNVYHKRTPSTKCGRNGISLTELLAVADVDRVTFLQSLLFIDDEMSAIDLYRTVQHGSPAAATTAKAALPKGSF